MKLRLTVGISQVGGTVKPTGGNPGTDSRVDDSFPWLSLASQNPPLGTINAFSPNFTGDYINIETEQGDTTTITLDFGAMITDPIISFTDVENSSTITFTDEFAVLASTSNLEFTTTTLSSDASVDADDPVDPTGLLDLWRYRLSIPVWSTHGPARCPITDPLGFSAGLFPPPEPVPQSRRLTFLDKEVARFIKASPERG